MGISNYTQTVLGQNILVGLIGLCCPGVLLALNGLGAGGIQDSTLNSQAQTTTAVMFSISAAALASPINNSLGFRASILFSTISYILYITALGTYQFIESSVLVILAGGLLGIGNSLFWVAQGTITMSYSLEKERGFYIGLFWVIFNVGAMISAMLSFGLNFNNDYVQVSDSTFIIFAGIMVIGFSLAWFLCPLEKVIRSDGTKLDRDPNVSFWSHLGNLKSVFRDKLLWLLVPGFFISNFYYSYEFNTYNRVLFNVRTRSLNTSFYWFTQIILTPFWSRFLDTSKLSFKKRGLLAILILVITICITWGSNYYIQSSFSKENMLPLIDFTDSDYLLRIFIFIGFSVTDMLTQLTLAWTLSHLTNQPHKLTGYLGFHGFIQSMGSATAGILNAQHIPYMQEYLTNFSLLIAACISFTLVILLLNPEKVCSPQYPPSIHSAEKNLNFEI